MGIGGHRMPGETRYLIQIERPGGKMDLSSIQTLLEGGGVRIDESYGPFEVDPKRGRYVVRGWITEDGKKKLEKMPGVSLFVDARVKPT